MKLNKRTCLKQELEHMDTGKLNQILLMEAEKPGAQIDEERVYAVLQILETRQTDSPDIPNPIPEEACEKYRKACLKTKGGNKKYWVLRCCVAAAVVCLLLTAIPRASGENILIDFFVKITEDVIAFFRPDQTENKLQSVYVTDHPGLQQLHDTVAGYGVTASVVPSWLSEEYELAEIKTETFPSKIQVISRFISESKTIVIVYEIYGIAESHEYVIDEANYSEYEVAGIIHKIYRNIKTQFALWENENVKCSIVVDCQEDGLTRILDSIYNMEDA